MKQVAMCTWCKATWPVRNAVEADAWLRLHPCPKNPKDPGAAASPDGGGA